jgi:hypothetical protein
VILLLIVAMLLDQGGHGPGRHVSSGDAAFAARTTDDDVFSLMSGGHTPSAGGHG